MVGKPKPGKQNKPKSQEKGGNKGGTTGNRPSGSGVRSTGSNRQGSGGGTVNAGRGTGGTTMPEFKNARERAAWVKANPRLARKLGVTSGGSSSPAESMAENMTDPKKMR